MKKATILIISVLATALFHREAVLSGFTIIESDQVDSLLNIFLLEHSFQALIGNGNWSTPPYFHPSTEVRGYTDLLLGISALYIPFRFAGLDPFAATSALLFTMTLLSFLSAYLSAKKYFSLPRAWAVLAATIYAISYSRFTHLGHLQLQFTILNPILIGCAYSMFCEAGKLKFGQFISRGFVLSLTFPLLLATNVYHFLFCGLFALTLLLVSLCFASKRFSLLTLLKNNIAFVVLQFAILTTGISLSLNLFGQFADSGANRSWNEVSYFLIQPQFAWWLGSENYVWGWISSFFDKVTLSNLFAEGRVGFGLFATGLVSIFSVMAICGRNLQTRENLAENRILVLSLLLSLLLPLKFSEEFSLWRYIYDFIPGADGLRAVGRYYLVLIFPFSILLGKSFERLYQLTSMHLASRTALFALSSLACGLLIAEQIGEPTTYYPSEVKQILKIAESKLDANCSSLMLVPSNEHPLFADRQEGETIAALSVTNFPSKAYLELHSDVAKNWPHTAFEHYQQYGRTEGRMLSSRHRDVAQKYQTYSALLAQRVNIPTVAGYSGNSPQGWKLADVFSDDLSKHLNTWEKATGLRKKTCKISVDIQ